MTSNFTYNSNGRVCIINSSDYSPFGVTLDGRTVEGSSYRYSFQGQEKDDEIKGAGNAINYKYRMHDPRVGRFFAIDPLSPNYPWYSPYQFSGNMVIHAVELEGLESSISIQKVKPNKPIVSVTPSYTIEKEYAFKVLETITLTTADYHEDECDCPSRLAQDLASELIEKYPEGALSVVATRYIEVLDGDGYYEKIFQWSVTFSYLDENDEINIVWVGNFESEYQTDDEASYGGVVYIDPDEEWEDHAKKTARNLTKKAKRVMKNNRKANKQFKDVMKKLKIKDEDAFEFSDYLHAEKQKRGMKGGDNFSFKELKQLGKDFLDQK